MVSKKRSKLIVNQQNIMLFVIGENFTLKYYHLSNSTNKGTNQPYVCMDSSNSKVWMGNFSLYKLLIKKKLVVCNRKYDTMYVL